MQLAPAVDDFLGGVVAQRELARSSLFGDANSKAAKKRDLGCRSCISNDYN
jgi:hypothetical protein